MVKRTIMLIIVVIIIIGCLNILSNKKEYIDAEDNFEWQAKYIWTEIEESQVSNKWVCFRKKFNIDNKQDIQNVICRIAADSKYWLYINGEIVVRDGQLKRGEKRKFYIL